MQKYIFEITYALENDIRNWLAAIKEGEFEGKKWRDGLYGYYLKEFDKISLMKDSDEAKKEISNFISAHFSEDIPKKKSEVEAEYTENFQAACEYIEKITNKTLATKHIKVYLTTFPRAPYSMEDGIIYFCIFWNNATSTLLHELLHMQVIKYWRNNKSSEISKLNEKEFTYLNESLTFLVNNFTNKQLDSGYEKHSAFRDELKRHWDKGCNFEELLSFAIAQMRKYSTNS